MRVYISGALNGVPEECRERYERFAQLLEGHGIEACVPHLHTNQELGAVEIYRNDLQAIRGSNAVVAFLDEPGLGTGAEIAISIYLGKPLVAVRPRDRAVSRFIVGLLLEAGRENQDSPVILLTYDPSHLPDVAQQVASFIQHYV